MLLPGFAEYVSPARRSRLLAVHEGMLLEQQAAGLRLERTVIGARGTQPSCVVAERLTALASRLLPTIRSPDSRKNSSQYS